MLIELGTDLFGDESAQQHRKDKKKELVAWFDHFFVGAMPKGLSDELKTIRNEWLPAGFVQERLDVAVRGLGAVSTQINEFRLECEETEYTDTDRVWELIEAIEQAIANVQIAWHNDGNSSQS